MAAGEQSLQPRVHTAGWRILLIVSIYNLWLVYLRIEGHSWVLIGLLPLAGIILSYQLLSYRDWRFFLLSLIPLPILIGLARRAVVTEPLKPPEAYLVFLILRYQYKICRSCRISTPILPHQWRIVGMWLFASICLYKLCGLTDVPHGLADSIMAGLRVRQFFERGILAADNRVLIEGGA